MSRISECKCGVDGCDRPVVMLCSSHMAAERIKKKPLYYVWLGMRQRCSNPKHRGYENYGGRGITICERWSVYEKFVEDMGDRPPGTSLNRIDGNGNYEPSNCEWATFSDQNINKRMRPNKLGYLGVQRVYYRYQGRVTVHGQTVRTQTYRTAEEAAWMRDQYAIEIHGDAAQLNFDYQ